MYELLFRSRWYALAWAAIMAVSTVVFTTTGAGAYLTGTRANRSASEEAAAKESKFRSWAEDDNRHAADEQGADPSRSDQVRDGETRDGETRDQAGRDPQHNTAPYVDSDGDGSDDGSSDGGKAP